MRFSVVIFESVLLHFARYCIFIRFSILKSVESYSYAEFTGNNIRFPNYGEQSREDGYINDDDDDVSSFCRM